MGKKDKHDAEVWECATEHKHAPCAVTKKDHHHGYGCFHKNISRSRGTGSFKQDFILGGCTAVVSKTCTAPMERVKLLLQTQKSNPALMKQGGYKGIGDCFLKVMKTQGLKTFWRGNGVNVLRYFPTQAFNFSFKSRFRKILCPYTPDQKLKFAVGSILAGGSAGASTLMLTYPLDYARTRLSADVGKTSKDR